MILGLDFETYSGADIKVGSDAYAAHVSTGIHCAAWAFGERKDGRLVVVDEGHWKPGDKLPLGVLQHIANNGFVCAHNCTFELSILRHVAHPRYGWPTVPLASWVDTAALAALCGLPVKLSGLARALGTKSQKDTDGAQVMKALMRSTKGPDGWVAPVPTGDQLERLIKYCQLDVRTMLEVLSRLPGTTAEEHAVRHVDLKVNGRGVMLDQLLAHNIAVMSKRRAEELSAQIVEITGGAVAKASATPTLKAWLIEQDVVLAEKPRANGKSTVSIDRNAIDKLLEQPLIEPRIEAVLERRVEASKATSLAKVLRVPEMVGADGRMRYALRYCGAHTGRWSSAGLQLHNMPKVPKAQKAMLDDLRRAVCVGDYDAARMIAKPNLMQGLSWLLRSLVIAAPGKDLIGSDYSAIEARVLAWLAGQADVLQMFALGQDVYTADAKAIGSEDRQLGKVCRLALGYGMGAVKFCNTAASYGIELPLKMAREIQLNWRGANANITKLWADLEQACHFHATQRGTTVVGRLQVMGTKSCVRIVLPSGRSLFYWHPRVQTVTRKVETVDAEGKLQRKEVTMAEFQFFTPGPDKEYMVEEGSYGGKLVENVTQAVARELMAAALVRLEDSEYETVLHVHDSITAEINEGKGGLIEFGALMLASPDWAKDLPMAVDSYRAKSFKG
jgi:DNA polymerase